MDKPTAALDPNAEYEIYTQFNQMITGKCAVLITHRLSAVQLADKVSVFDDGHMVEYGTHAQLYAEGGRYTEMFDKQAQFYRDSTKTSEEAETYGHTVRIVFDSAVNLRIAKAYSIKLEVFAQKANDFTD